VNIEGSCPARRRRDAQTSPAIPGCVIAPCHAARAGYRHAIRTTETEEGDRTCS
jgi:hypothetical protein